MKMNKTALVTKLPKCDFCDEPAEYDGKTKLGPWANMCEAHFQVFGVGLGTGRGQKLTLETPEPSHRKARGDKLCLRCGKKCPLDSWNKTAGRFRVLGYPKKIEAMLSLGLYCEEV